MPDINRLHAPIREVSEKGVNFTLASNVCFFERYEHLHTPCLIAPSHVDKKPGFISQMVEITNCEFPWNFNQHPLPCPATITKHPLSYAARNPLKCFNPKKRTRQKKLHTFGLSFTTYLPAYLLHNGSFLKP